MTRAPALLQTRGVTKTFDGLVALADVSVQVRQGQIKGLIGPNGAGKTTLFNIIAGELPPSAGDVEYADRSIAGLPPYRVAALGVARTFQNVQIFPGMSVLENVLVGLHRQMSSGLVSAGLHTAAMVREEATMRRRAAALLAEFGLEVWADTLADRLPFGVQRVVEMARATAAAPRLLLLDEPGAGLNPSEKARVADLIRQIHGRGVTILLVEHDMPLVMGLADEVAVLDRGSLIADGPPAAVRAHPQVIEAYLGTPAEDPVGS